MLLARSGEEGREAAGPHPRRRLIGQGPPHRRGYRAWRGGRAQAHAGGHWLRSGEEQLSLGELGFLLEPPDRGYVCNLELQRQQR